MNEGTWAAGAAARILVTLCLLALAPAAAETNKERGQRVAREALAALGGENFLAMRDRVESGRAYSFYREQLSGLARATIYTRYLTPPNPSAAGELLLRERQSFGKEENSGAVLFTGGAGYEVTFRGARPLAADRVDRYRETTLRNVFYILRLRLNEPGLILESKGADIVDNQPVEIVSITDADNREVTVCFHRSTKLPVRQVFYRRDPKTRDRIEEVTVFSKYRDVGGGVQWPFSIQRTRDGEKIFEMYAESVTVNQDLTDGLFLLPSGIKMLKPEN